MPTVFSEIFITKHKAVNYFWRDPKLYVWNTKMYSSTSSIFLIFSVILPTSFTFPSSRQVGYKICSFNIILKLFIGICNCCFDSICFDRVHPSQVCSVIPCLLPIPKMWDMKDLEAEEDSLLLVMVLSVVIMILHLAAKTMREFHLVRDSREVDMGGSEDQWIYNLVKLATKTFIYGTVTLIYFYRFVVILIWDWYFNCFVYCSIK